MSRPDLVLCRPTIEIGVDVTPVGVTVGITLIVPC
jgi:hypothetical protein